MLAYLHAMSSEMGEEMVNFSASVYELQSVIH